MAELTSSSLISYPDGAVPTHRDLDPTQASADTTGKPAFAMCRNVCRERNVGHTVNVQHTAKTIYTVRQAKRPTANVGDTAKHESLPCA